MKCSRVKAQLPKYVDSELGEAQSREVADHLEVCAACRSEEASLRAALGLLTEWREAEPRLAFSDLMARVDSRKKPVTLAPVLPVPKWAAAALAVASIAGGALLGVSAPSRAPSVEPASEQQIASAMDLRPHDAIEASLVHGFADEGPTPEGEPR